jgi:rubrerythrin
MDENRSVTRELPKGWKPWISSKGCDVVEGRKPGSMKVTKKPGEHYVECRYCHSRIYSQDLGLHYNVDNPPDECPKCGAGA